MEDVYKNCPIYENESFVLRMVRKADALDLLKVYSDKMAVPFFNSDNCGGDDFYYTTENKMEPVIDYWFFEYNRAGFVRWTVVSKAVDKAIGTIELFHRDADDYFTNCGLLRLDIRSDYEFSNEIIKILDLIIEPAYTLFNCDIIATKANSNATERIKALKQLGFEHADEILIGHDGTRYDSYYVLPQKQEIFLRS
ncbi:GNAT family N-acetyltransferase [Wansuia hejianensis]|uniref:N-acetyltransferase n=1 Tax=Wansuia hejianensis TaxID=2763667 RepID=A0A7G9GH73_9FIRM|nr:N-acetyltransferase [Wansuia hejianensis]QNM10155.1 N-acetyltransferase [Wansuia hejianensis]RHV86177.1 N-acetyltransferase [Lachnospiraceae bacterium OF09-33XD]